MFAPLYFLSFSVALLLLSFNLSFRFLHFVLLSSSRCFFSTFLYILPCLSLSSFQYFSIFLHSSPCIFRLFLPLHFSMSIFMFLSYLSSFLCLVSTNLYSVFASFLCFFLYTYTFQLSFIHCVYALFVFPFFPSFALFPFPSPYLKPTIAVYNQVYKSEMKHLQV